MQAIIFALISYFGWGTGDVFGAIVSKRMNPIVATFYMLMIGFLIATLYVPFALIDLSNMTTALFGICLLLGLIAITGNVLLNYAFTIYNPSIVGTIAASFPAISVILSFLFFKEELSLYQVSSILIIFLGVILVSLNLKELRDFKLSRGLFVSLIIMVLWGIYFSFIRIPSSEIGWFWPAYITVGCFPAVLIYMKIVGIKFEKLPKNLLPHTIAAAFLLRSGEFSYNLGINAGLTSIVAPVAGSYATLFAVLSSFIFKERISKQQIVGIAITLTGIVALAVLSS